MKYTNFTELPIHAFQPKLGKGPFSYGMTLEGGGGGGGGIVGGIVNAVSSVFEGAGKAVESVGKAISDVGVSIDKGVNNAIPGGWVTVGTVALMVAAPYAAPYLAAEAGAAGAISAAEAAAALEAAAIAEGATTAGMVAGTTAASTAPTLATVAEAAAVNAAKSAAMNSAAQLVTTGSIDPSQAINAGVTGGVTGGLNSTLNAYNVNPMVSSTLSGTVGGALNASINDRDVGMGALTGGIGGTVGGATNMVGKELGLNPYAQGALSGATSGMTGAALNDKSVGIGGLTGAAVGAAGTTASRLGTALQNEVTGDADRRTMTGDILGSAARSEVRDLLTPDDPRRRMPMPMPRTMLAGAPSNVSYLQPGALPQAGTSRSPQSSGFTPRMSPAGAPIFGNEQSSSSMLSQTGMPSMASTTSNTADVSLAGGAGGVPVGSSPNANVGSVTGLFPSSGLNAAGLPAPLASGVLTSQALSDQSADTPQMSQLKQLYPQLENVDPRILASLTSKAPVQTYARGGAVQMNKGGSIDELLERIEKANRNARFAENDRLFKHAAENLGPAQNKYAARVPFGDPSGNYNRPISSQYFVNRAKGGEIHGLNYGSHKPEFITGATGHYVKGKGDGQSDDIPAMLADGEYVFDADTVAALGNGSSDAGAKVLDKMRQEIRKHKRSAPVHKIPPKAKSPLEYIKKGKA
jgi:hypothetical protein